MMIAARILRPSKEGWKLLVSALKHRWLSMAIWSWKVLPVSGSCGGREAVSGLRPPRLRVASGQGDHVHTPVNRLSPSRLVSRFRAL